MSSKPVVRILHLITQVVPGGAQENTLVTCELHDRSRFEVNIAANPSGALRERALRIADGRFFPVPHLVREISPAQDARALAELVALLRRERFDLIHAHCTKAGYLGRAAARFTGTPCVFTYHGFAFHDFMPAWQRQMYVGLERIVRGGAQHYITLSERDRREAIDRRLVRADASTAIYTGIDLYKVDRVLDQELGTDSNIGAFVDRWEILSTSPGADGAAFFVFHALPPYDPAALPRSTRLERVVAERLADGRGWDSGLGRLVRQPR